MTEVTNIPVNQVEPGNNDRQVFDRQKLEDLAASIQKNGLAQPITVRPIATKCPRCNQRYTDSDGLCFACTDTMMVTVTVYQIVAGERRFRAISQVLGWPTVPAIIRKLTDEEASAIMLVENTSREDLNPIDEATAYRTRQQVYGWSVERIAETAGKSPDLVKRRLSLLVLTPDIQRLVATGNLPVGHAEALSGLTQYGQTTAMRIYQQSRNLIPLSTFRNLVSDIATNEGQAALFDLEDYWTKKVLTEDVHFRGKKAIPKVPTRSDLPAIPAATSPNTGALLDHYIFQLLRHDLTSEAALLGSIYTAMVQANLCSIPANPLCR